MPVDAREALAIGSLIPLVANRLRGYANGSVRARALR